VNESLTNRQIAFLVFGTVVGYGILGLPKTITEKAGTGGWFTLIMALGVVITFTCTTTYLAYVHENKTLYDYSNILVGKYITIIFMIIYIMYFFIFVTMITRISSESIKLMILINTPVWALSLIFLSVAYYAVIKRLGVIARICEIYGFIIVIGALIIYVSMFTQGKLINLKPFFIPEQVGEYVKATVVTIVPFLGIEILTIIPIDRRKNDKKIFKYVVGIVTFIGILYILNVESCISVMGVDGIVYYEDALFATIRRIDIKSLEFLERIDGIFIVLWLMAIFCTITLGAYGSIFMISKLCKNIKFELLAFVVITIGFIVSQVPRSIDDVRIILEYLAYLGLVTSGLIPIILLVVTKVKKL
jgi:spore germination protein